MSIRRCLAATLLASCAVAGHAGDMARWIEVRDGGRPVHASTVQAMKAGLQAAGDASVVGGPQARRPRLDGYVVPYRADRALEHVVERSGFCVVPDGRKLDRDWVAVEDGGKCDFGAQFDTLAKRFTWFAFNGNA